MTRPSNEPLKALYRQCGFLERVRLPGYYAEQGEDGSDSRARARPEADRPWRDAPSTPEAATTSERLREAEEATGNDDHDRVLAIADKVAADPAVASVAHWLRIGALEGQGRQVEALREIECLVAETGERWSLQRLGEHYGAASLHEPALGRLLAAVPLVLAAERTRGSGAHSG